MITRTFQKGDAASVAVYSDCERYRYSLTRVWDEAGARALFIMLNPSTGDGDAKRPDRRNAANAGRGRLASARSGCSTSSHGARRTRARCAPPSIR